MDPFFVICALIVIGWLFVLNNDRKKLEEQNLRRDYCKELHSKYNDAKSRIKAEFDSNYDYSVSETIEYNSLEAWIYLIEKEAKVVIFNFYNFNCTNKQDFGINEELHLDINEFRKFEIYQEEKHRIETVTKNVPVSIAKKKSALGRGLIGGVVFGPVGLVLGAASGLQPESRIIDHKIKENKRVAFKGPPVLVIVTNSLVNPTYKLKFKDIDKANDWKYMLEGTLEKCKQIKS